MIMLVATQPLLPNHKLLLAAQTMEMQYMRLDVLLSGLSALRLLGVISESCELKHLQEGEHQTREKWVCFRLQR